MTDIAAIADGLTDRERSALRNARHRGYGWPSKNLYQHGFAYTTGRIWSQALHRVLGVRW